MGAMATLAVPGSDSPLELARLLRDAPRFLHERFERHGRVFKTRIVYPVVFLVGDQANKTILVTRRHDFAFGAGYAHTAVQRIFEGSIMLQDGEEHARTREVLSPAVGKLAVRESVAAVRAIWEAAATRAGGGTPQDVYGLAERATFDVAANALTGLALGGETEELRPYFERLIEGIMSPVRVAVPFSRLWRALAARRVLHDRLRPRVLAARDRPASGLLGQLACSRDARGEPLPADDVIGHLLLLFWAGYDTTASAASWAIHELARRVDWQERIRRESSNGDDGAEPPDTSAFLSEVERMYPSALFFPRVTTAEVEIDGYLIPEGTPVFYSPYLSHRDPATFEHPNAFDPERWLPSRGDRRASQAKLVGFGGGPRVCLGKSFAKMQLRVMLHTLVARWRVEPDPTCRPTVLGLPVHHPLASRVRFFPLS
jgi:cytochrome P450